MLLPANVYGEATEEMQRLLNGAQAIDWFHEPTNRRAAVSAWEQHLGALRTLGFKAPPDAMAMWFSGAPSHVVELNESCELRRDGERRGWFDTLNQLASSIQMRFVESSRLEFVGPPLWAFSRVPGIRSEPLIATSQRATECNRMFPVASDAHAAWTMLCLAEEVLSLALGWECAYAASQKNPFAVVLDVYGSGVMPLGWDAADRSGFYTPEVER